MMNVDSELDVNECQINVNTLIILRGFNSKWTSILNIDLGTVL